MADMQSALLARLKADAGVAAITTRLHWSVVPQASEFPYVRMQTVSDPRPQTLKAYDAGRTVRVQVDCMAKTYAQARALTEAIIAATAQPASVGGIKFGRTRAEGPRDLGEDVEGVGFVHRLSMDLLTEFTLI